MKPQNKIIAILVIVILLLLGGGFWYTQSLKQDIRDVKSAHKKDLLRNNELVEINAGYYRTLVADTLTQKQLNKEVDKLLGENAKLKVEVKRKAKVIQKLEFTIKELSKPIDYIDVGVDGDTVTIEDFYPNKENPFVTYKNKFSLSAKKGESNWSFGKIEMGIVLFQRDDGLWESDIKVPDWINVGKVDIQATPLDEVKIDKFGWLLGASYGKDFRDGGEDFVRISGGLRFSKFYIDVGASSNSTVDGGIKFEF